MLIPFKIVKSHPSMISEREKKVEENLEAASMHHVKAIALLNEGEYEKAAQNALLAQKYLDQASETTREKTN
ncbi:MAG TPA: hypothetical protein VK809_00760 [Bacteroidia bacterium]|jgi:hypothetical protein|nr:hypothetical protein [Bacteroidia bacterium]